MMIVHLKKLLIKYYKVLNQIWSWYYYKEDNFLLYPAK